MDFLNRLIGNLKISSKLLLVVLPLAIALVGLFSAFINQQSSLIRTTEQELQGVEQYPQLLKLMESIQRHRGLSQIVIKGDASAQGKLQAEAAAVNDILTRMPQQLPADWAQSPGKLRQMEQSWNELKNTAATSSASQSFEKHTALVHATIELIRDVADDSTMTFDPEVATYYLISASNFELPFLHEQVAILRGKLSGYAAKGESDPGSIASARQALSSVNQYASGLVLSYDKVEAAGVKLDAKVGEQVNKFKQEIGQLTNLVNTLENNPTTMTGQAVFQQVSATLDGLSQLAILSKAELKQGLTLRIERESGKIQFENALAAFFSVILTIILVVSMRKISEDTKVLLEQAKHLSAYDLRKYQVLDSGDEMGMISKSIENIRSAQHTAVMDMQKLSETLQKSTAHMTQASQQIANSTNELARSRDEFAKALAAQYGER